MSGKLDAFLKGSSPEDGGGSPAPEPERATPEARRTLRQMSLGPRILAPVCSTVQAPPKAVPTPPEPDDDAEPGEARASGQPVVPRRAYETEQQKRQNWVERASKAEAERDMLAKQLEEARKAPPPATAPPSRRWSRSTRHRDPEGYTRRMRGVVLNEQLNTSEMLALEKHGKEAIDARPNTSKSERKPIRGCGTSFTPSRTRING